MSDQQAEPVSIVLPALCVKHQRRLLKRMGIGQYGPWKEAVLTANNALFRAVVADPKLHKRLNGDLRKIRRIGCLACYHRIAFRVVVEAGVRDGVDGIARIEKSWSTNLG